MSYLPNLKTNVYFSYLFVYYYFSYVLFLFLFFLNARVELIIYFAVLLAMKWKYYHTI